MELVPDLSALNPAERETLALLSQGHTAKSIANLTGRSLGSVNERLREARRKTGVGSSRELARLLAEQENRDEQIGVAGADESGAATAREAPATGAGGRRKGIALMSIIVIGAAALALFLQPGQPQTAPKAADDPLLGRMAENSPSQLHAQVRAEPRDMQWAPAAETSLRQRYAVIRGLDGPPRVTCGARTCEVAGTIRTKPATDINPTMDVLQGRELNDDVLKLGFAKVLLIGFTGGNEPRRAVFYTYWRRAGR